MSTLGDLTVPKIDQSGPHKTGEFTYIDISSIDNTLKRIVEPKRLSASAAPSRAKQRLRPGDVLVSMTRPNLNAVAIVPPDVKEAVGSTGFHVLRAVDGIESRWLLYAVQTHAFIDAMSSLVQGALYPAVRPKDIRGFGIEAPPFEEQQRIVAEIEKQFSRLDKAVANLMRVKANLKGYKAAVLRAAVEGKLTVEWRKKHPNVKSASNLLTGILAERRSRWEAMEIASAKTKGRDLKGNKWRERYGRPADFLKGGNFPQLPKKWIWTSLESIADVIDPNPSHRMPRYVESGTPLISSENFTYPDGIDFSIGKQVADTTLKEQRNRFRVSEGDFVLSRIGTIGKTRFLPVGQTYCLSHALVIIKALSSEVDPRFLRYVVSSDATIEQAKLGVQSVGVPDLGMGKIRSFRVPLTCPEEQGTIVEAIESRLTALQELERQVGICLQRADRLRQSILSRAFEGKLVSQDPTDAPADVLLSSRRPEDPMRETFQPKASGKSGGTLMPKTKKQPKRELGQKETRSLYEVLSGSNKHLTPDQLFAVAGFEPEGIEEFYEELRREAQAGRIYQERPDRTTVYLRAATNAD